MIFFKHHSVKQRKENLINIYVLQVAENKVLRSESNMQKKEDKKMKTEKEKNVTLTMGCTITF